MIEEILIPVTVFFIIVITAGAAFTTWFFIAYIFYMINDKTGGTND